MKKITALFLSLLLVLSLSVASAEGLQSAEITIDPIEGATMQFASLGIELTIPEILVQTDVPAELAETEVFDCYALADGSAYMLLGATQMQSDDDITNLITALQADSEYSELGILTINGASWLTYANEAQNMLMFTTNVGEIMLTVYSSPYNDEGFRAVMLQILGTVAAITE